VYGSANRPEEEGTEAVLTWKSSIKAESLTSCVGERGNQLGGPGAFPRGESTAPALSGNPSLVALPEQREPVS